METNKWVGDLLNRMFEAQKANTTLPQQVWQQVLKEAAAILQEYNRRHSAPATFDPDPLSPAGTFRTTLYSPNQTEMAVLAFDPEKNLIEARRPAASDGPPITVPLCLTEEGQVGLLYRDEVIDASLAARLLLAPVLFGMPLHWKPAPPPPPPPPPKPEGEKKPG